MKKTSIGIKKILASKIRSDGSAGYDYIQLQNGSVDNTVEFSGSEATVNNIKSLRGRNFSSDKKNGDVRISVKIADLNKNNLSLIAGMDMFENSDYSVISPYINENKPLELTLALLTNSNYYIVLPRVSIDCVVEVKDQGIHSYNLTGYVLNSKNQSIPIRYEYRLTNTASEKNDIISFNSDGQIGDSVIDSINKTVYLSVSESTNIDSIISDIVLSVGAVSIPASGDTVDYTNAVDFKIESASGNISNWVVTINGSQLPTQAATPPSITSSEVLDADPTSLYVYFDKDVDIADLTDLSLSLSFTLGNSKTLNSVSGTGTNTLVFVLSSGIESTDEFSFVYGASNTIYTSGTIQQLESGSISVDNQVRTSPDTPVNPDAAINPDEPII